MTQTTTFKFTWEMLGDLSLGRPNIGPKMRVEMYRMMLFSMRDVLERRLGPEETVRIFYEAGTLAGWEMAEHMLARTLGIAGFVERLKDICREMGIGVINIESVSADQREFTIAVSEDLDCSGLPNLGTTMCQFDEGLIAALLEYITEQKYTVREVECWATGARVCRFVAHSIV